ncbi:aminoglycoside phosphotransferase family protein, partial [Streptomyces lasiicapitis]
MYTASSSVSAPPRPLRPHPSSRGSARATEAPLPGGGPYLAPARPAAAPLATGRTRRVPATGAGPLSGRLDLSGPQGAQ